MPTEINGNIRFKSLEIGKLVGSMKKFLLSLVLFMAGFAVLQAQAPSGFKYQAVVRDGSGALIQDQAVTIKITLIEGSADGQQIYAEKHKVFTNPYGLVSLTVGRGIVLLGDFDTVDWGTGSKWIGKAVDPINCVKVT